MKNYSRLFKAFYSLLFISNQIKTMHNFLAVSFFKTQSGLFPFKLLKKNFIEDHKDYFGDCWEGKG